MIQREQREIPRLLVRLNMRRQHLPVTRPDGAFRAQQRVKCCIPQRDEHFRLHEQDFLQQIRCEQRQFLAVRCAVRHAPFFADLRRADFHDVADINILTV